MAAAAWSLSAAQRDDVVQRLVNSICALCHAKGVEVTAEVRVCWVGEERCLHV